MTRNTDFDVVLFGATGFTGGLTAEYLAANAPDGCRWALAGRSLVKLEGVRDRLAEINPDCKALELIEVDARDTQLLRRLARRTRVVISTVGPYVTHGGPLVAACADVGTDYVDLCGEPEFVDLTYTRHHEAAVSSGARIVHACGFDSIPYDLGVYFTVAQLPQDRPIRVDGFVRASGLPSGGTLASALLHLSRQRQMMAAARYRRSVEPTPVDRRARAATPMPRFDRVARAWVVPLPTIDPVIVAQTGRSLAAYGPDFTYRHHAAIKRLPVVAAGAVVLGVVAVLAQIPPLRERLSAMQKPGDGPDEERRERSWFTARFHGIAGDDEVVTEVSGGDPAYGETSKMLAESALCLAFDDLPSTAGQVTTAVAMGDALLARLSRAGLPFTVLDRRPTQPPSRHPDVRVFNA